MNVYIKNINRKKGEFQFFKHQFVEAWIRAGGLNLPELFIPKINRWLSVFCQKYHPKSGKAVLICASGSSLLHESIPYSLRYEIIPMLWDCWPCYWDSIFKAIDILQCKTCFVTSSQVAEILNQKYPLMKTYYIPEGIDSSIYKPGNELKDRQIDVYELGRQHNEIHQIVMELVEKNTVQNYCGNTYHSDGTFKLSFTNEKDLLQSLPNTKIVISFPQCDTNPARAGKIETLTQRYWESMLSRTLIIGRAPKELVYLIGYNPVIEINVSNTEQQITEILSNIESYQSHVNHNYESALSKADWSHRMSYIFSCLKENGYSVKRNNL